jgi:uncharacterized protein
MYLGFVTLSSIPAARRREEKVQGKETAGCVPVGCNFGVIPMSNQSGVFVGRFEEEEYALGSTDGGLAAKRQSNADPSGRGFMANWKGLAMPKTQIDTFKPPSADDPVLPEVVRRLVEVYHPQRIYLFGSAARGDAGPDSDFDLMVIVADEAPEYLRRGHAGYRALRGTGVAADLQVWPQGAFNRQLHLKASFPSTVVREGKLLYGA